MNLNDAIERFHIAIWNFPDHERLPLNTELDPEQVLSLSTDRCTEWDAAVEKSRSDRDYWERLLRAQYWHLIKEMAQKAVQNAGLLRDLDPLPEPHALVMESALHDWVAQL